jgi:hypothetical protein
MKTPVPSGSRAKTMDGIRIGPPLRWVKPSFCWSAPFLHRNSVISESGQANNTLLHQV